jgi:hypothetical protein
LDAFIEHTVLKGFTNIRMAEYQLIVPILVTVGLTDKTYLQTGEQFLSFVAAPIIKIFDIS